MENIKSLFAKSEMAKKNGLKKADFSYLSKNGKCPSCSGNGKRKTSMDFMSDIWLPCDMCKGLRYSAKIGACKLKGHSVGEVLQLTINEALEFFESDEIIEGLNALKRVSVGHLRLGQPGNTLSGGEAQRLKLATALMQKRKGTTLYLFDEPSNGLHYLDIQNLTKVFQSIIEKGDTILFIEHNSALIDSANTEIRLGPGSGENGGEVM